MSYLYGDSSPSSLESNFIEFLRDALDFTVKALGAAERLREHGERAVALKDAGDAEVTRLESLGELVGRSVTGAILGDNESPSARCAEAIGRAAADLVRGEVERMRSSLGADLAKLDALSARERESCVQALAVLLGRHDLPDMKLELTIQQAGARYGASVHATTPCGLEATLDVEVPPTHLLGHPLRVDKLVERLEIQAPEAGGWLRKEVRPRPHRIDKDYIAGLFMGLGETKLTLRAAPDGTGAGFGLLIHGEPARVRLLHAGDGELPPFDVAESDAGKILDLQQKLIALTAELLRGPRSLREARFDGVPLAELKDPKALVVRLIDAMAPVVQEIARRSLSPAELVLKRLVGDGRREEIFVSKDELRQKLVGLSSELRGILAPLGLADPSRVESPARGAEPLRTAAPRAAIPPAPTPARRAKDAEDDALVLDHSLRDYLVSDESSPGKWSETLPRPAGKAPPETSAKDRTPISLPASDPLDGEEPGGGLVDPAPELAEGSAPKPA